MDGTRGERRRRMTDGSCWVTVVRETGRESDPLRSEFLITSVLTDEAESFDSRQTRARVFDALRSSCVVFMMINDRQFWNGWLD